MVKWDRPMSEDLVLMIEEFLGPSPDRGAEIGVFKGLASKKILTTFPDIAMVFVDPWREWEEGDEYFFMKRTGKLSQKQWDSIYDTAIKNINSANPGVSPAIWKETSEFVCKRYLDGTFDFVFIDACHTFKEVKKDIELWLPKVRQGGLLCGHDYGGGYRGVKRAVVSSLGEENINVRDNRLWGYVVK